MASRKGIRGFTLIELLVVVAIMAILASIAYPMYQDQVRKSRRGAVKGALMQMSQYMERNFTEAMRYDQDAAGNAIDIDSILDSPQFAEHRDEMEEYYNLSFSVVSGVYTITAVPQGGQAADPCKTMTVDGTGKRTPDDDKCW